MHSKKLTPTSIDSRGYKGTALAHVTSTRGYDHLRGIPGVEWRGMPPEWSEEHFGSRFAGDPAVYDIVGKPRALIWYQHVYAIADGLEMCKFPTVCIGFEVVGPKELAELFSAVTGVNRNETDMLKCGERIYNLERSFDVREGITRKDDHMSERFHTEPLSDGPYKGERLDLKDFDKMLDKYYELRGWDIETGIPTRNKLEELGLKNVADELENMRKPKKTSDGEEKRKSGQGKHR